MKRYVIICGFIPIYAFKARSPEEGPWQRLKTTVLTAMRRPQSRVLSETVFDSQSYKPLMRAVLRLQHEDMQEQRTRELVELFGGNEYGGLGRWGGILHLNGKIYANNFVKVLEYCGYLSGQQIKGLLRDLQKNKQRVLVHMFYAPRAGWIKVPYDESRVKSLLDQCSQSQPSDALQEVQKFLEEQISIIREAENLKKAQSQARITKVTALLSSAGK